MYGLRIGLTGANGFVGSHIAETCLAKEYQLTCLLRKTSDISFIKELDYQRISGDILDKESLCTFVKNQHIIIHNAGVTKARNESEYMQINADGTKLLLEAIQHQNPEIQRVIFISSQAAAGPTPTDLPLDESQPKHPITTYGRSKALAEEICFEFSDKIPITIIRPPAVFGPRDKDVYQIFKYINKGIQPILGTDNIVSIVSVQNLVHGILLATEYSKQNFESYFITDDREFSWQEFSAIIAKQFEKKPLKIKVPSWFVGLLAIGNEIISKTFNKAVLLNKEKILEMKQPRWVASCEKAKIELGYKPVLSTEKAIGETILWYKEKGWL